MAFRSHRPIRLRPPGSLPFSADILSQSLYATALDPREAFRIARRIQREVVKDRLTEIDRSALRALAYQELTRSSGREAAERYLALRRYEEPEKPVIILLGETSGVGKTTLALEVVRRMGIGRVLSTDSIPSPGFLSRGRRPRPARPQRRRERQSRGGRSLSAARRGAPEGLNITSILGP